MNATLQQCQSEINSGDYDDAEYTCGGIMQSVLNYAGNLNVYNIDLQCNPQPLCYDFSNVTNYLNQQSVQQALGIQGQINWQTCNDQVNSDFGIDVIKSFRYEIPSLLANNIRVVIYNGDLDLICNWIGGKMWVESMNWPGRSVFSQVPLTTWNVNGVAAGETKSAKGLTFVRVYQAGHMVPHDQPKNALALLNNIISGKPF